MIPATGELMHDQLHCYVALTVYARCAGNSARIRSNTTLEFRKGMGKVHL